MKKMQKRLGILCLTALMLLSLFLVACQPPADTTTDPQDAGTTSNTEESGSGTQNTDSSSNTESNGGTTNPPEDPTYTYTVTVLDADGNPVSGITFQLCSGSTCFAKGYKTDSTGVATITRTAEDPEYKVSVRSGLPAGMTLLDADGNPADSEGYFHFNGGKTLSLQLVAA